MQIFRLNKSSDFTTKAIIISHMDLDGVMSAYLCDIAFRGCTGYTEEQVQVVGEYSPEPKSTLACLKQVLYKLKTDDELSIFILDRSNMTVEDINNHIGEGWIKPNWKITCIDHHTTNFKQEDYEKTIVRVNQIVDNRHSAAMNVLDFFSKYGYEFDEKTKELTRLTSIYDRFAWLIEDISEEDERNAKYLNRACGINHRNEFINIIKEKSLDDILGIGKSSSEIISMIIKKTYMELVDDNNDLLIHTFTNGKDVLNIAFIRKHIDYMFVSELSEYIFNNNENIHVVVYIDSNLGSLGLRSREGGKYLNLAEMIKSMKLKGGGHPGAAGYYANKESEKKELIDKIYKDQSQLLANFIDDVNFYLKSQDSSNHYNYIGGDAFFGMDEDIRSYLEDLSNN